MILTLRSHHFRAMNCQMSAHAYSDDPQAAAVLHNVEAWMHQVEAALSRFRPESDLSRLNAQAGRAYHAGPLLWAVTEKALQAASASQGHFDPTIGAALIAAGYDRSFERLLPATNHPIPHPPLLAPRPYTWQDIRLDHDARTIFLPEGCRLDLGGIAKGWAADYALALLNPLGPALVDAGGDLAVGAPPLAAGGWALGVADPLVPEQDLALITVAHAGVATSGSDHRRWHSRGRVQHHIIDPYSQRPADTGMLSATVIASDACTADVLALEVMLDNAETLSSRLQSHPDLPLLLVYPDGRTDHTPSFARFVQAYNPVYTG